jgi:hypothetical protein
MYCRYKPGALWGPANGQQRHGVLAGVLYQDRQTDSGGGQCKTRCTIHRQEIAELHFTAETNRIQLVLSGMLNRTFDPYLVRWSLTVNWPVASLRNVFAALSVVEY